MDRNKIKSKYFLITLFLTGSMFGLLFPKIISGAPLAMVHQVNSFSGSENPKALYIYRNILKGAVLPGASPNFGLFFVNVFDYETVGGTAPYNKPLFGGGRTNALFAGMKYSLGKSFDLIFHNAAIWFYDPDARIKFMDIIYLDPVLKARWKAGPGFFLLNVRLRSAFYVDPVSKQDFREKIEVSYLFRQNRLRLYLGDEININLWPAGNYRGNDFYAGVELKLLNVLTLFGTFNWEKTGSENYYNTFVGMRLAHRVW